jgi:hypothetical protein
MTATLLRQRVRHSSWNMYCKFKLGIKMTSKIKPKTQKDIGKLLSVVAALVGEIVLFGLLLVEHLLAVPGQPGLAAGVAGVDHDPCLGPLVPWHASIHLDHSGSCPGRVLRKKEGETWERTQDTCCA